MMEQLIQLISDRSGLPLDISAIIAEAIVDYFEGELPYPQPDRRYPVLKAMALVMGPDGQELIGSFR
jgi:hypothetical protein